MAAITTRVPRLTRAYLWVLGAGLLIEGGAMLALGWLPNDLLGTAISLPGPDPLHNGIHVLWGAVILCLLALGVEGTGASLIALCFGVFYVALGFLGILVHHPFGLLLGAGENVFHFIVGPLALVLGAASLWVRPARRAAAKAWA